MPAFARWRRGLRALLRRDAVAREVDDEIAAHLAFEADALIAQGVEPAEAHRRARLAFGSAQRVREGAFEERGFAWAADLGRDLRQSARQLRRTPAATAALVLCAGLGIAGVTTVFSFLNAAWLRPLPYEDDAALHGLMTIAPARWVHTTMPAPVADTVQHRLMPVARSARYLETNALVRLGDTLADLRIAHVDSAVFSILRVAPAHGRSFSTEEYATGARVALLSPALWAQLPAAQRAADPVTIRIDGEPYRVVGRMPPSMRFHEWALAWIPLRASEERVALLLRRDPGVGADSLDRLLRRQERIAHGAVAGGPPVAPRDSGTWRVRLTPLVDRGTGRPATYVAVALVFAVAVLVAIATASNVASQLVARARRRRHELATCAALGATAPRIARRLLADAALIGGAAGVTGVVGAHAGVHLLLARLATRGLPGWLSFAVDWRVLGFALVATLALIAAIGLLPVREASRIDPLTAMREAGSIGITPRGTRHATRRLLALQVAVSVLLVSAAAITVQGYRVVTGLIPEAADARRIDALPYGAADTTGLTTSREVLLDSLRAVAHASGARNARHASVRAVRAGTGVWQPPRGERLLLFAPDDPSRALQLGPLGPPELIAIDADFPALDGRRLLAGRPFTEADAGLAQVPLIVTSDVAAALWGDTPAVGRALRIGRNGPPAEVVGVVSPRLRTGSGPRGFGRYTMPEVFLPYDRAEVANVRLRVEAPSEVEALRPLLTSTADRLAPQLSLGPMRTVRELADQELLPFRSAMVTVAGAALLVVIVALIGLYGLAAQAALARRPEMGIRLALGATEAQVVRLVIGDALQATLAGIIAGVGLAVIVVVGLQRVIDLRPLQLVAALTLACLAFGAVMLFTCWLPVRRAARMAPADVLRAR